MKQNIFLFGAQNKKPEFELDIKDVHNFKITGRTTKKDIPKHFSRLEKILKDD